MRNIEIKDLPHSYIDAQPLMEQGVSTVDVCGLNYVREDSFEHNGKQVNSYVCKQAKPPMYGTCVVYAAN